jgi:RNA polymerase sigma-70 factor (ECF subfamily)
VDTRSLVERAQRGDHEAFAELAAAAVPRLDRVARLILRDPDLAQDAVQESCIRAWRDLRSLRDPSRFEAWLQRLTVRACLAMARSRRRRAVEVDLGTIDPPDSLDVASSVAERDFVGTALRGLEPDRRALVVMHVYLGVPLPEVADALRLPLGTAKSRLSRALAALRVATPDDDVRSIRVPASDGGRP